MEADAVAEDFLRGEVDVGFGDLESLRDAVGGGFEDGVERWEKGEDFWRGRRGGLREDCAPEVEGFVEEVDDCFLGWVSLCELGG